MQLPQEALNKLKEIWEEENPEKEISDSELIELGIHLIKMVELFYKPMPVEMRSIVEKVKSSVPLFN
ncbi:MAG: hypothetical protein EOP48_01050 [Sphingobacteriales bacterium]|nr:MAG: hypothetical protein EOP48_01050 [Sphingobacteriales bacterium]